MKMAVLGTGMVGQAIGGKLVALGHDVMIAGRGSENPRGQQWAAANDASYGAYDEAAAFGELVFLCTLGEAAVAAIEAAGPERLEGKIVVDVTNPLDFSQGMPPVLSVTGRDSLGERVQAAAPTAAVVKTLNTVNCELMVDPGRLNEPHDMLLCGNDADAKARVTEILTSWFGWSKVLDLGDITASRGMESWLPLWIRLWGALGTPDFNLRLVVSAKRR